MPNQSPTLKASETPSIKPSLSLCPNPSQSVIQYQPNSNSDINSTN